jgi:riboflavin transporter FmnP
VRDSGLTISAQSGWVGIVMHFLASGTLVLVAGGLFKLINGRWTKESSTEFKRTAMQIVVFSPGCFYMLP